MTCLTRPRIAPERTSHLTDASSPTSRAESVISTTEEAIHPERDWSWVIAAPFRAHVRRVLTAEPMPWRAFAGYVRLPDSLMRGLLGVGRRPLKRIPPHYAHTLLCVDPASLRADLVRPIEPDCALVAAHALLAAGWTVPRIAREGCLAEARLRGLLNGDDLLITQRTGLMLCAAARAHRLEPHESEWLTAGLPHPMAA